MGTWISHFRVAELLLERLPGLDAQQFVIGNVAPDSGRPNHDWTSFDPPKSVTHFLQPGDDEGRIRDLTFYREFVGPLRGGDPAHFSFMLGYFTHLVTDNLWMHLIGHSIKQAFAAEFAEDKAATWGRVKDDWYGLDHKYLRDCPDNAFARWVMGAPNPPSPFAFLPSEALAYRLDDLREFYSHPEAFVLDRKYPYFSEATMNRAVQDCAREIAALLEQLEAGTVPDDAQISLHLMNLPPAYLLP
ncbi:zinc dependent phospholipase C family protein [Deinococcus sp. QL22]|uniref:zinc dependent phospholipase C family protein n=1 Tax=Deinococcus sp. QL22 TaxID=2939437 RepID=UPI0020174E1C|nr:zinc dependent phospholipase C family protein [Deinococcus sp. QL22]UQN05126.1 zinc dependent phospholipase C family protein [Deinococcus sp. QL22]